MAKSRNRSRDARKRAAKKRKNRLYQDRKRMEASAFDKMREIAALTNPKVVETYNDLERNDGTRQSDTE